MSDLREAARQALEALERPNAGLVPHNGEWMSIQSIAIAALRAALAQEQAEPDAYPYASRLAASIWERHYKGEAPNWKPLDDLMGVLTQIDNMATGLTRQGQEQADPVAWLYEAGTDRTLHWQEPPLYGTPLYTAPPKAEPVQEQATPQQSLPIRATVFDDAHPNGIPLEKWVRQNRPVQRQPLSGLEVERLLEQVLGSLPVARNLVRAVEQAHGIGEQP